MIANKRVIVTMTSWTKRIENCHVAIEAILGNTLLPDIMFLNLSLEEFPNREADLPQSLVELIRANPIVKIIWVDGPNTKSMKKVFPILQYIDDEDMIIIIDDDLDLPDDFVETRVKEFVYEHGCKFPISGGTNPKYHLNKPLYDIKFNYLTSTSIFQKKMLKGYGSVICKELIETYKDDTIHTMLCLSNGYHPIPSKYLSTWSGVTEKKIPFVNDVFGMKVNKMWKSDTETISIFTKKFNEVMPYTFRDSLMNLVMFDSHDVAGDNGEIFYRFVQENYPWVHLTFILSKDSDDWTRLEKDGFNLVEFEDPDIKYIIDDATFVIWSKDTSLFKYLWHKPNSIFASHGTGSSFYNSSEYYKNRLNKCSKYICCSSDDEEKVLNYQTGNGMIPIMVGFPRHDQLLRKSNINRNAPNRQKQILIAFHYRSGDIDNNPEMFKQSQYLYGINKFLNSEFLQNISNRGVKIVFLPHARIYNKYKDLFYVPNYIELGYNNEFQTIFSESDALITDFSSTSFEFAYMNKPTLCYIPDEDYVRKNCPQYSIDEVSKYNHIVYCEDLLQLETHLNQILFRCNTPNGFNAAFKYVDRNNSERLFNWIIEHRRGYKPSIVNTTK